jgi:hypothetical protein
MINNKFKNKRVMHIDTSTKLYENKTTGIAYKIIPTRIHKGIILSKKLKKGLRNKSNKKINPQIYSIIIYYLIKEDMEKFDILVICADERYKLVKKYLDILFRNNLEYHNKKIMSIGELRQMSGNKKIKSYADSIANSYRKRGPKSIKRRQVGIDLNIIKIQLKDIILKLNEIISVSRE